jgi:hypothetical protein
MAAASVMPLLLAMLTLLFARPEIQPAKPGPIQTEGQYVVSPEGAFRIEKGKVQHLPKKFHPAFLFLSDDRFKVALKAAEREGVTVVSADANTVQLRYSDGFVVRKGSAKALTASHEIESTHAITVSPSADEYLLIRWVGGCTFTLMKNDGEAIKEVATNIYSCDH